MKKIIVPVDFTGPSDASIGFAKGLGQLFKAQLQVVYCWFPTAADVEAETPAVWAEDEKCHQQRLDAFLNKHDLPAKCGKLMVGFPGQVIVELSKREDTLMVVMGTVEKYGVLEKLLGSVASHVSKKAKCPVLLVPPKVEHQGDFKKILVAGEAESTDEKSLRQIIDYTKKFNAEVEFANVSSFDQKDTTLHISDEALERITQKKDIGFPFSVVNIYISSVEKGLNDHCEQNGIDLLVLATRSHPWWEGLFKHNIEPEKVAIDLHRPILVMQVEK